MEKCKTHEQTRHSITEVVVAWFDSPSMEIEWAYSHDYERHRKAYSTSTSNRQECQARRAPMYRMAMRQDRRTSQNEIAPDIFSGDHTELHLI